MDISYGSFFSRFNGNAIQPGEALVVGISPTEFNKENWPDVANSIMKESLLMTTGEILIYVADDMHRFSEAAVHRTRPTNSSMVNAARRIGQPAIDAFTDVVKTLSNLDRQRVKLSHGTDYSICKLIRRYGFLFMFLFLVSAQVIQIRLKLLNNYENYMNPTRTKNLKH